MTGIDLVREVAAEFGQDVGDDAAGSILWNYTGYPHFFDGDPDPVECFRDQLREYFADPAGTDARIEREMEEADRSSAGEDGREDEGGP